MTLQIFESVAAAVAALAPDEPVYCLHRSVLARTASRFLTLFPGRVLYALKCNPHPAVVGGLYAAGIRDFDAASLPEIVTLAQQLPAARASYMHPVKSRASLAPAYAHGVRHFVVDHEDELDKLRQILPVPDLTVLVRLATATAADSVYDLSSKFGCTAATAEALWHRIAGAGWQVGLAFHVGSQCRNPAAFTAALTQVEAVAAAAGGVPAVVDVGGGFPVAYDAAPLPDLAEFMETIRAASADLRARGAALWCEPGRALVAPALSLLLQVQLRKDDALYLNDGIFGSLAEMFLSPLRLPVRMVREPAPRAGSTRAFRLFGPTCDSVDVVPGVFELPADVHEGDWLEVGCAGAYTQALASRFNGFYPEAMVEIAGE